LGLLDGKVAVVTGAAQGIGRATALRFAGEGASLVLNDLDGALLEEVAAEASGEAVAGDAARAEIAREVVAAARGDFGGLDILVCNAGATGDRMFHRLDDRSWDAVLDANLRTAFQCALAATVDMRATAKAEIEKTGHPAYHRKINFTSSTAALTPAPGQANYAAAKGAIISLTRTLARELGPFRINVNAVAPGFIDTRLTSEKTPGDTLGMPPEARASALEATALGYFGSPNDVANAHLFLASSEADFVSGAVLPVSGGLAGA
jgi:3-oxoacyl-[acyl-carrier protein] reductase